MAHPETKKSMGTAATGRRTSLSKFATEDTGTWVISAVHDTANALAEAQRRRRAFEQIDGVITFKRLRQHTGSLFNQAQLRLF